MIASYLATHQSKLKAGMALSLLSSLMQGVVAVVATSIAVAGFTTVFCLFQIESVMDGASCIRFNFVVGFAMGVSKQVALCKQWRPAKTALQVNRIHFAESSDFMKPSAVKKRLFFIGILNIVDVDIDIYRMPLNLNKPTI